MSGGPSLSQGGVQDPLQVYRIECLEVELKDLKGEFAKLKDKTIEAGVELRFKASIEELRGATENLREARAQVSALQGELERHDRRMNLMVIWPVRAIGAGIAIVGVLVGLSRCDMPRNLMAPAQVHNSPGVIGRPAN